MDETGGLTKRLGNGFGLMANVLKQKTPKIKNRTDQIRS